MGGTTVEIERQSSLDIYLRHSSETEVTSDPDFLGTIIDTYISQKPCDRSVQDSNLLCKALRNPAVLEQTLISALEREKAHPDRDETVCRVIDRALIVKNAKRYRLESNKLQIRAAKLRRER